MSKFLVFDIGCYECGEPSEVVGVYATREEAKAALARRAGNEDGAYFIGGQHSVEIFELPDEIAADAS